MGVVTSQREVWGPFVRSQRAVASKRSETDWVTIGKYGSKV